jgi:hypothetical protein
MKNGLWVHDKNISKNSFISLENQARNKISVLEGGMHRKESGA